MQRRGNLAMAKSLHRQDVFFEVSGLAAYKDKGEYIVCESIYVTRKDYRVWAPPGIHITKLIFLDNSAWLRLRD